jgi:hypothetical protein
MPEPPEPAPIQLAAILHPWGCRWGLPGFERNLTILHSKRLTKSLGRCNPATGTITLRADLPPEQLPYVLCHEAAHIAVFLLFGPRLKPHGPEWSSLVTMAGFTPSAQCPGEQPPLPIRNPPPPTPFRYAHQCLVCQTTRWARRPIRRWRCAECLALGLTGEMKIIDTHSQKDLQ